jgi:gas vesicle protein
MRFFSYLLVVLALFSFSALVNAESSGWNLNKTVKASAKNLVKDTGNKAITDLRAQAKAKAQERSKELRTKASELQKSAVSKANDMKAQAKGKSAEVQAYTKKRADTLVASAKEKAKSLEEQAKKAIASM